ncbi:LysR substrate-binding domain-containing protein [Pseudonocardia acidicola]|uniref:LysR family transcriptional regulator n=1 Tax=Pseudonocardia acidicola TaxID=2724939 RepID=A0ABX1S7M3_9PSEU|nr:LysR substrate-binding domain-containing protein [Pseudonocardia acidicola]NMH97555.1 LysR family transcriptional regulator [Pseudonocardia acidicola]
MSGHVELRHLRAFVAVAEELHFSRAAKRLNVVQQSLSAQIRQLEDELGVRLFRRTTRSVELSDAGRVLLPHARSILGAVATACEQTRRASSGEAGRLAISYTPTVAAETLPRLVGELHARHPDVALQMCEMWQAESVDAVNSGRFDVGLARCPVVVGDVECMVLREEALGVVLGARHPLAARVRVPLAHLALTTLTIWPRELSPGFYDQVVGFFRAHGFVGRIQEFEYLSSGVFHSDPAAREEIARTRAFSIAFETQFDPMPDGFVWRAVDPAPLIPVHLFWRRSAGPVTRNFLALALEVAGREGWVANATPRSAVGGPR